MSARTRFSAALVLVGCIGFWSVVSAAPAPPKPEAATAARTRAELTRNREALRKVMTVQAHGAPPKRPAAVSHGAGAATNAAAGHGAPVVPDASAAHAPLAARVPGHGMVIPKSGTRGGLGGPLASNTLTPVHHSPAAPVILGGAPVRRNVSYGVIDGNVFHHKP